MKKLISLFFLVISLQGLGQDYPNLSNLTKQVINKNNSDSLNLVSIFDWITENIAYDTKTYFEGLDYPEFGIDRYLDSASYMKVYNQEVSEIVITTNKAICDGYSRLFLTLCEHAGLKCQYITGKVKLPLRKDFEDHAWNAVFLDGEWKLLDLTWASGGITGTSFVKEKNMFFYFTPPKQLIYDHYPDDLKWSLLDSAEVNDLLNNSPVLSHQPFKAGLIEYFPKSKVLNIDSQKPFKITLEFDREIDPFDITISGSPTESLMDQFDFEITNDKYDSLIKIYPDLSLLIPKIEITERKVIGNKHEFTIRPLSPSLKTLDIYIGSMWPAMIYQVKF